MIDYDKLTEQCVITITGPRMANPELLRDVMARTSTWAEQASSIVITCIGPEKDGSEMIHMGVTYRSGGGIHIGCLRRSPTEATEFHS